MTKGDFEFGMMTPKLTTCIRIELKGIVGGRFVTFWKCSSWADSGGDIICIGWWVWMTLKKRSKVNEVDVQTKMVRR